ncbi:1,4-dihydroxy-6-naphthoate synthase [Desulfonatronum parangueonense]
MKTLTPPLTVGISPCPNDTFIFGSWILGRCEFVTGRDASFIWDDVQQLNESAARGKYDLIKVSAAQALLLRDQYAILRSGGAFGLEHGPKLVASAPTVPKTIAVPGLQTTAAALLRQAWPEPAQLIPMRYDQIVDQVRRGRVDAGLLIHESALLLREYGLVCLLDLGQWWKDRSGDLPLPLGCILARKDLDSDMLEAAARQIQLSLEHATAHPEAVWPLVQGLAQELDDVVLQAHIRAYVNNFSRDMGEAGKSALRFLGECVRSSKTSAHFSTQRIDIGAFS